MYQFIILISFIVSCSWGFNSWNPNYYRATREFGSIARLFNSTLVNSESNINVTETFLEIEEEITLEATWQGSFQGDSASIEFIGTFCLPEGAIIRSSLLWFGDDILKGKLLDSEEARAQYEEVVDRDAEIVYPIDPSLIEKTKRQRNCWRGTEYSYSIYPVNMGEQRTMRVRYDIPWDLTDSTMFAELMFIANSFDLESEDRQTAVFSNELDSAVKFQTLGLPFTVIPGFSYDISDSWETVYFTGLFSTVTVNLEDRQWIKETHIDSGALEGFYQDILIEIPEELRGAEQNNFTTGQLKISNMGLNRIMNVDVSYLKENNYLRLFYKSDSTWTGDFEWLFFNSVGDLIQSNVVAFDSIETGDSSLVYQWAYSQDIELGHYLGYVDSRMSLLALEQDTLPEVLKNYYWDQGVPLLNPDEIFAEFDDLAELGPIRNANTVNSNTLALIDSEIQELVQWTVENNSLIFNLVGEGLTGAQVKVVNLQGQVLKVQTLTTGSNILLLPNINRSQYIVILEYSNKRLPIEF